MPSSFYRVRDFRERSAKKDFSHPSPANKAVHSLDRQGYRFGRTPLCPRYLRLYQQRKNRCRRVGRRSFQHLRRGNQELLQRLYEYEVEKPH